MMHPYGSLGADRFKHKLGPDVCMSMQLVAAVPAGLLTDKCRRDTVLRIAAGIGLVAGLTLAYCLFFSAPVWAFMIAMGLVGAYKGFNNPAIESIFADSVQRGKRYRPFPSFSCSAPSMSPERKTTQLHISASKWVRSAPLP